jgi:predicted Abi (CAAX) family protease
MLGTTFRTLSLKTSFSVFSGVLSAFFPSILSISLALIAVAVTESKKQTASKIAIVLLIWLFVYTHSLFSSWY